MNVTCSPLFVKKKEKKKGAKTRPAAAASAPSLSLFGLSRQQWQLRAIAMATEADVKGLLLYDGM